MREVKIAFVGAGYMAGEHAKAFFGLPGVELVGIYSRTRSRAEELAVGYPGMTVCESVDELYGKTKADMVVVTVKELAMREVASECFRHPWAILLEKPAGYNLDDAEKLHNAATVAGANVYVALNRRAYSSTRQAIEILDQNPDDRRFVTVLDQQDQSAARDLHRQPPEVVQNYMFANSIHLIDYFNVLCRGEVSRVDSIMPWTPDRPGIVLAKVEYSSGDVGLYEGNWEGPGPWAVAVVTAGQRIEMRPLEQVTVQLRGERKAISLEIDLLDSNFKPGLRYQAGEAVAAVRNERHSLPNLAESMRSMRLVADIFGLS